MYRGDPMRTPGDRELVHVVLVVVEELEDAKVDELDGLGAPSALFTIIRLAGFKSR